MMDFSLPVADKYSHIQKAAPGTMQWRSAVSSAVRNVNQVFDKVIRSGDLLKHAGEMALKQVQNRTGRGQDGDGGVFRDYTRPYKTRKKRLGKYTGKVDLSLSGEMREALAFFPDAGSSLTGKIKVRRNKLSKGTITAADLARIHHKGEGSQPARKWLGWRKNSMEDFRVRAQSRVFLRQRARQFGIASYSQRP